MGHVFRGSDPSWSSPLNCDPTVPSQAVRQGLKEYSDWPTYPQLYGDGKLVGGLDIMKELAEEDELFADVARPLSSRNQEPLEVQPTDAAQEGPAEGGVCRNICSCRLVGFGGGSCRRGTFSGWRLCRWEASACAVQGP